MDDKADDALSKNLSNVFGLKKQKIRIYESKRWKKAFFDYLCSIKETSYDYPDCWTVIEGFVKSNIVVLHKAQKKKAIKITNTD